MDKNWLRKQPHGNDLDAVIGYRYIAEAEQILSFWSELVENNSIHTGTNFDLSDEIESIDRSRKLYIHYDFMHRVMLHYYDPEKETSVKEMNLEEFKTHIRV